MAACVIAASPSGDQPQIQGKINPLENQFPGLSARPAVSASPKPCEKLN